MNSILKKAILDHKNKHYPELTLEEFINQLEQEILSRLGENIEYDHSIEKLIKNILYNGTFNFDKDIWKAFTDILGISDAFFQDAEDSIHYFCDRIRVLFLSTKELELTLEQCNTLIKSLDISYCPEYSKSSKIISLKKNLLVSVVYWYSRKYSNDSWLTHSAKITWTEERIIQIFESYISFIKDQNLDTKTEFLQEMRDNINKIQDKHNLKKVSRAVLNCRFSAV